MTRESLYQTVGQLEADVKWLKRASEAQGEQLDRIEKFITASAARRSLKTKAMNGLAGAAMALIVVIFDHWVARGSK